MTLEQAQLILSSCRPNGCDDRDPAFEEALHLAATDPELGSWLAREKAQDTAFAEKLACLSIPENLRDSVFDVLAAGIDSPGYDQFDQTFIDALAEIAPPASLRAEILGAMEVETKIAQMPQTTASSSRAHRSARWKPIALTAAAGLVAALLLGLLLQNDTSSPQASNEPALAPPTGLDPSIIETNSLAYLTDTISLDLKDKRQEALFQYLASNDLPVPDQLPQGLRDVPGMGCRKMDFKGKEGSLICFQVDPDQPLVHLVVMHRSDVHGDFPTFADASEGAQESVQTDWSIAKWQDEDRAFFLMSNIDPRQLAAIF